MPHHGGDDVSHPAYVRAVWPRAAILNNGETKGAGAKTLAMLHRSGRPRRLAAAPVGEPRRENFADERIANLDTTTGFGLKLSATDDGAFTITNQRTGATRTFSRPSR